MIHARYLFPGEYISSAFDIDYQALYDCGVRGLIFDIDNTLTTHGDDATAEAIELVRKLFDIGFTVCFLSNNDEERCERFNRDIGAFYIHKAGKPLKKGYISACFRMKCNRNQVVFVGDQLFTDVYGANNAGIRSILVKPIAKREELQIVLKRILEKPILLLFRIIHPDRCIF